MSGHATTGQATTGQATTGQGGNRVVLDTAELHELAELVEFTEHRVKAVKRLLADVRAGLALTERVAPDEAGSAGLATALDGCSALLTPLGTALSRDHAWVADVRRRALAADAGPKRPLPPGDVERLLAALAPTTPSSQLAVMEALLLGGLRRTPVRTPRQPGAPRTPATPATGNSAAVRAVVRMARTQLGTRESGDNGTKYGRWYGMDGVPWCAIFVSWIFAKAGHALPALQGVRGFAGVAAGAEALRRRGELHKTPKVGDIWLHRGPSVQQDHTGIVVAVHPDGSFTTIEGNSSDAVREVRRPKSELASSYGFGRPLPS